MNTLDQVREHVRQQHHKALQKYLCQRDAENAADDERFNLGVNRILRDGFAAKNGITSVSTHAIRVLRKVPGTDPEIVWKICLDAIELARGTRIPFDMERLRRALEASIKRDPQYAEAAVRIANEVLVREIMER